MDDELVEELAKAHHVTPGTDLSSVCAAKGHRPDSKSLFRGRMKNNQDIFDFELTGLEMSELDTMPPAGWSGEHPDRVKYVRKERGRTR